MSEYVPSDQDVEDTYASTWLSFQNELGRERFREWLAAHDARVRRDAAREALAQEPTDAEVETLARMTTEGVSGCDWARFGGDARNYHRETARRRLTAARAARRDEETDR